MDKIKLYFNEEDFADPVDTPAEEELEDEDGDEDEDEGGEEKEKTTEEEVGGF